MKQSITILQTFFVLILSLLLTNFSLTAQSNYSNIELGFSVETNQLSGDMVKLKYNLNNLILENYETVEFEFYYNYFPYNTTDNTIPVEEINSTGFSHSITVKLHSNKTYTSDNGDFWIGTVVIGNTPACNSCGIVEAISIDPTGGVCIPRVRAGSLGVCSGAGNFIRFDEVFHNSSCPSMYEIITITDYCKLTNFGKKSCSVPLGPLFCTEVFSCTEEIDVIEKALFSSNNIEIYPNPAKQQFTIIATEDLTEIKVFNLTGQPIKARVRYTNTEAFVTLLGDIHAGMHFIQYKEGGIQKIKKIAISE